MILDAAAPGELPALDTDVCVVGGGAAGISIARSLGGRGREVVLLEGGGLHREPFSSDLYAGEVEASPIAHDAGYLTASRLRYFGGATNHWAGWCRPLDPLDFEPRPWIPHSGWPLRRAQLDPFYRRAAAVLEVEPFDRLAPPGVPGAGPGSPGDAFEAARFLMSPPTRFGDVYRDELWRSGRVRVLLHANAVRIGTDDAVTRVTHVEVRPPGRPALRVRAGRFVLATGGIENARLLLVSGPPGSRGLGNAHDLVGRYFMEHPHVRPGHAALVVPSEELAPFERHRPPGLDCDATHVLTLRASAQRRRSLPNADVVLRRPERALPPDVARASRVLARLGALGRGARGRKGPPEPRVLVVRLEPVPNPASRVVLDDARDALGVPRARLAWHLSGSDGRHLEEVLRALAIQLGRWRWGRCQGLEIEGVPWPETGWAGHHIGTTRMHRDPRRGVVDADCRVHGLANLYVAGSSVFPTAGAANPTLTIVALALRLADHLAGDAGP